jgi:hypothetical protein
VKGLERETQEWTACGYGLLGLCCSDCLLGPCRLTPFDESSEKGLCGDDRDRMVAKHLLRLAVCESGRTLKLLADATRRIGSLGLASSSLEASKDFLSLSPVGTDALVSSRYPEKIFPPVHRFLPAGDSRPISLAGLVLDSVDICQSGSAGVEAILDLCLRLSLLNLIGEEFLYDLDLLTHAGQVPGDNRKTSEILERLPSAPCPFVIRFTEGGASAPAVEDLLNELDETVPIVPIEEGQALSEIARGLFQKWNLPATGLRAVVLVSSGRVTATLGALALGFNVASFPPLPIHGSNRAKEFFFKDFRNTFGNGCLPSPREGFDSVLAEYLGGKG